LEFFVAETRCGGGGITALLLFSGGERGGMADWAANEAVGAAFATVIHT